MKVLILGGNGMLGHRVYQVFSPVLDTWITVRSSKEKFQKLSFFNPSKMIDNVNMDTFDSVKFVFDRVKPDVVINCVGIVKKLKESENSIHAITINALLPHWLEALSMTKKIKVIHISTDCVFSGKKGNYSEKDVPDAYDLYGRSKLLGEVTGENCLTIRTSIIGREIERTVGLVEWFLSQKGKSIKGYKNAIFSGFTTSVLAEILLNIIRNYPDMCGLYHVSSKPINKFDLLCLIRDKLGFNVDIKPDEDFFCDRSLDSSNFCGITKYSSPSWDLMITDLIKEIPKYEKWRRDVH
ncbi:MAG: SDR family oxidoreductase [bacterium]|nr:SDR family oxidoreductase [bacterium]